jgi:hypothetical protein
MLLLTTTLTTPLVATAPASAGVTVTSTTGSSATEDDIYSPPYIADIWPFQGPMDGGTFVTITGSNFVPGATTVTIDIAEAENVNVVNSTTITATTPPGGSGAQDVRVTTPGGSATLRYGYNYVAYQEWLLDSAGHAVVTANRVMTRSGSVSGSVTPVVSDQYWISNAASGGVTFDGGTWIIRLESTDDLSSCTATIGQCTSAGAYTAFLPFVSAGNGHNGDISTIQLSIGTITVAAGNYLALRVTGADGHTISTIGKSGLVSPISDPNYPVPELGSGVLLALGLAGIGAFVLTRKTKAGRGEAGW